MQVRRSEPDSPKVPRGSRDLLLCAGLTITPQLLDNGREIEERMVIRTIVVACLFCAANAALAADATLQPQPDGIPAFSLTDAAGNVTEITSQLDRQFT